MPYSERKASFENIYSLGKLFYVGKLGSTIVRNCVTRVTTVEYIGYVDRTPEIPKA